MHHTSHKNRHEERVSPINKENRYMRITSIDHQNRRRRGERVCRSSLHIARLEIIIHAAAGPAAVWNARTMKIWFDVYGRLTVVCMRPRSLPGSIELFAQGAVRFTPICHLSPGVSSPWPGRLQPQNPLVSSLSPALRWNNRRTSSSGKGAITSKIKHAIKLKTRPARLV